MSSARSWGNGEYTCDANNDPGRESRTQGWCRVTPAQHCRKNGWRVGMRLSGREGENVTVIEITAIGRDEVLGVVISENGEPAEQYEMPWTFEYRRWRRVK